MSRTRRERLSARTLSESEAEEDVRTPQGRERLKRMKVTNATSHLNSTQQSVPSESNQSLYSSSSNHHNVTRGFSATYENSKSTTTAAFAYNSTPTGVPVLNQRNISPESPSLDISAVQCSIFDKFRWLLWRYIYLKIISSINFDVWLLLRLRRNQKTFIFLPLLIFLLYLLPGAFFGESAINGISKSLGVISSSLVSLFSYLYSWIYFPPIFTLQEELPSCSFSRLTSIFSSISSLPGFIFSSISSLPGFIFSTISSLLGFLFSIISSLLGFLFSTMSSFTVLNCFFQSEETDSIKSYGNSQAPPINTGLHANVLSKQEYKSLAFEVLEERMNEILQKFQLSHNQANQNIQNGIYDDLQLEISGLQLQFRSLSARMNQLQNGVHNMEKTTASKEGDSVQHNLEFNLLKNQLKVFGEKLESLSALKKCCDEKWTPTDFITSIEKHLLTAFKNIIASDRGKDSPYRFFNEWLDSKFIGADKLSADLNEAYERFKRQQPDGKKLDQGSLKIVQDIVQHHVEALKRNMTILGSTSKFSGTSFSLDDMRRIVKEAIMLYDADKTGLVDYALESAGGSILGTRCSESYVEKNGKFSVFGLPLWSDQNTPRTAIQPDIQPGKCWAFKGSQGFLVIQLSYTIHPTGFTLEHIPISLSPTGSIDSAPKEFSVWGLSADNDNEGTLLGKYFYDQNGEPLQYFPLQNLTKESFAYVELKIHSNHGNLEYTCLYRFRVHGTRAE